MSTANPRDRSERLVKRYVAERPEYIVAVHVDDCPIPAREWEGKPYANLLDDCVGCPFCAGIVTDDNVSDEDEAIQYVLCPESLTDDEKGNPELWGWRGPDSGE